MKGTFMLTALAAKRSKIENVRFVSTFDYFNKEKSGKKPYTVRDFYDLPDTKYKRAQRFMEGKTRLTVTISKGYTSETITRTVTDVTLWRNNIIFAWNPNEVSNGG